MADASQRTGRPFDRRTAQAQRLITAVHTAIYKITGGRLLNYIVGAPSVLLMTVGRKTGKLRTTPLIYLADGDRIVLVASNGGTANSPAWWTNLKVSGRGLVQIKRQIVEVRAEQASPDERARLWPLLVEMYPGYAGYQQRTDRLIPVVILHPAEPIALEHPLGRTQGSWRSVAAVLGF